jgi:acetyl-CoA acyltransferase
VVAGHYDVVVAGGVESMSRIPMGASLANGGHPYPEAGLINQVVPDGTAVDAALALAEDRWRLRRSVSPYRPV